MTEIPQLMEQDSPQKTQKDKKHKRLSFFCVFCPFVFFVVNLLIPGFVVNGISRESQARIARKIKNPAA
jgi:hypothetical protein